MDAHPLFTREKIVPKHTIQRLTNLPDPEQSLFGDLNGIDPEGYYQYYQHDVNWRNRIIHADSTAAMASLLEFDNLGGQVQLIYFDPPYGINFDANFQMHTHNNAPVKKDDIGPNDPANVQAFRDTFENGIHSYLDTVHRIATYGRELLADSGSFILQIGNDNMMELGIVLNEVFGKENRVAIIPFAKTTTASHSKYVPEICDYLLWYAKDKPFLTCKELFQPVPISEIISESSTMIELQDGTVRKPTKEEKGNITKLPSNAKIFQTLALLSQGVPKDGKPEPFIYKGKIYHCPKGKRWRVSIAGLTRIADINRMWIPETENILYYKKYYAEIPGRQITNLWSQQMRSLDKHYVVETAESVIERCILMGSNPGDLILDPTCGSGTTAYVAEKHGRRWITIDTSAVAVALSRQRLATATFDHYLLQDSLEGANAEKALNGTPLHRPFSNNVAHGFVHKRVQEVSAASLAYDEPQEPTLLIDQPVVQLGCRRVSGPFSVDHSSPHRYIQMSDRYDGPDAATDGPQANLIATVLHALQHSGIHNPENPKNPLRIRDIEEWGPQVTDSDQLPGFTHIGQLYRNDNKQGTTRREKCALLVTPDDIPVPQHWINRAAEEAMDLPSCQHLFVVGFAFEASSRRGPTKQGRITIHRAQVNQDLTIGQGTTTTHDDIAKGDLKTKRHDQVITMLGEPDIAIHDEPDGRIRVEILGYQTYNPSTGDFDEGNAQQIAYWAVDTQYDGLQFCAWDAHFPHPQDKQLKRLQKALGARMDPDRWACFVSLCSAPFPRPDRGRIMVRIVTTSGTEMERILDVPKQPSKTK